MACLEKFLTVEECWLNGRELQQCRFLFGILLTSLSRQDELERSPTQAGFSFSEDRRVMTATLSLSTASFQLHPSTPSDDSV